MSLSAYHVRIDAVLAQLGAPKSLRTDCPLPLQLEADNLVCAGPDMFDRQQQLTPVTCDSWHAMRLAAETDGIALQLVSGFRSVEYQCQLIQRKLNAGQQLEHIFKVNAIPGYSEHHTGRALDLSTPGCEPLSEAFEATRAFAWLQARAAEFGFVMTYPRDNIHGIIYEPWHWCCHFG